MTLKAIYSKPDLASATNLYLLSSIRTCVGGRHGKEAQQHKIQAHLRMQSVMYLKQRMRLLDTSFYVFRIKYIRESVDSLCRDGADVQLRGVKDWVHMKTAKMMQDFNCFCNLDVNHKFYS